jgi:penicillin-binding protein 1C
VKLWKGIFPALLIAPILLWLASWPPPLPGYAQVRAEWRPSESWLHDRNGRLIDSVRVDFCRRRLEWIPLASIAPILLQTVIAAEDRNFSVHQGVDWLAILGSIRDRWRGHRVRGASTITMQLAGFLSPELAAPGARGLWDKARQMRAAMAIEGRWTKDQILEAYLNLAGFRGEAQGIMAASQSLFGKAPAHLSADEAAILTALLPNPQADIAAVARRACLIRRSNCGWLQVRVAEALGPVRTLAIDPGMAPHLAARKSRECAS